ncbi:hypothetical protein A4X06_0g8523 [Tilletia controversa]|uniref:Uncharacterized protein n=4 Tax=Tilletia TaxID=13289 RepID=A0A8X7MK68_9BASI|nr:hypothetical protein A4X06_0g8523 [Tilletia controversa]
MAKGMNQSKAVGTQAAPIEIPSSSSEASSNASLAISQLSDHSTTTQSTTSSRQPWSIEETVELVKLLKDNIHYQTMFLPGHNKSHAQKTGPAQKTAMLRAMRDHIFGEGKSKTEAGVKSKIISTVERYRHFLRAMSTTGQGLLLEEMFEGPIKNAREQLLAKCPWWEDMHEMMRDRNSSDPSKLVTGAGEIKPQGTASQIDEDTSSPDATEDVFSEDDIDNEGGMVGLGLLSQVAARRAKRRYESEDEEDQDIDMDSSMSTPRASATASSSKLRLPVRSLPQMSRLIDASENYPMAKRSVQREPAPKPTVKDEKGKAADRSDFKSNGSKSPSKTGKSSASDKVVDDFGRYFVEDREHRSKVMSEKEQTKRLRLELRSQDRLQDREKDKEFLDRRMDAIINKLDVIHTQTTSNAQAIAQLASSNAQAIAQLTSRVDTFMNKVDMVAMVLHHITPGGASGPGAMGRP